LPKQAFASIFAWASRTGLLDSRHAHGHLPGSFDPLTNGHLDIVHRAARLFDKVIVAVAKNESKNPLFTMSDRLGLVRQSTADLSNVSVDSFEVCWWNTWRQMGARP
jgi:pantetheine-phosphate adenylyltransferase